ncbi:MAG: hypothetical protein Kow00120_23240 [Anaerolineae bacterium]
MDVTLNIKVALMDSDIYALHAVNSYLAWDRRTRVVARFVFHENLVAWLAQAQQAELPDVTLYEVDWTPDLGRLHEALRQLGPRAGKVLGLSSRAERERILAASRAGAAGYLVKGDVRIGIAGAVVHATHHEFVISHAVAEALADNPEGAFAHAEVLPGLRRYPGLTDRVEQALRLCVIEGMPADLAADEMGVSPHTIRSYVKEGYRILESHDDTHFPIDLSPQERAFMRFTALREDRDYEF